MALAAGYKGLIGLGMESLAGVWGTLVAPTKLLPAVSESLVQAIEMAQKEIMIAKNGRAAPDLVHFAVNGVIKAKGSYRCLEHLLYAALAGTDTKTGSASPWTHTMELADELTRSFSTVIEKDVTCFNVAGCKTNKLTINAAPTGVFFDFDVIGKVKTHATTHRAALAALSFDESNPMMFFDHCVIRIADCTDALAVGDVIAPSEFTFELNNNLATDIRTTSSQKYIAEPKRNGHREVMLTIKLPFYDADTFFTARDAGTKLQADIIFTGPTCGAGVYKFQINLPTIYVTECKAPTPDEKLSPVDVTFQCCRNNGNANMTETEELQLIMMNGNDTVLAWTA